ncbi:unnamed protein product, partial [Meganyctiphanes norvegica]
VIFQGVVGPAHVHLQVSCIKMGTLEPGIILPVNIHVADVNDNAPVFENIPEVIKLSEVMPVGNLIGSPITAVDADQPSPLSTIEYSIGPGPGSDAFTFTSPLGGQLLLARPLTYDREPSINLTIIAK